MSLSSMPPALTTPASPAPARPGRRRWTALSTTVLLVASLLFATLGTPTARAGTLPPTTMALGLAGPYDNNSIALAQAAGVKTGVVEMSWFDAEPAPGVFDDNYLAGIRWSVQLMQQLGFRVSLNIGVQDAPQWFLNQPGARFVDQYGHAYTDKPVPNLVFGKQYRAQVQAYLTHVFAVIGTSFDIVRVGWGVWGELTYPYEFQPNGKIKNQYWAFDPAAQAADPVPGWRPGDPSPHGEASTFLTWYLNAMLEYQNWQISVLRSAGYSGPAAVLYPSFGMRPGDFQSTVATNLSGTSNVEINGEVQRGYDFARLVKGLTDRNAVVYTTWAERTEVVSYLSGLAASKGLRLMAENAGPLSQTVLNQTMNFALLHGVSEFFLIRASDMNCVARCNGAATLAATGRRYQAMITNQLNKLPKTP